MFWIVFNYRSGVVGARIHGDKATVYWNTAPPREKTLKEAYTLSHWHPMEIQEGVFLVAGLEAQHISNLRIIQSDIDFNQYFKENRKGN